MKRRTNKEFFNQTKEPFYLPTCKMAWSQMTIIQLTLLCLMTADISTEANHVSIHHMDDNMSLNERFFDDVRALIKRHLKKNVNEVRPGITYSGGE